MLAGGRTAEELYERTIYRAHVLRAVHGYRLYEIWECSWNEMRRSTPEVRDAYDLCEYVPPPLDPRKHALRGGRVEAFSCLYEVADGEIMEMFDVICMVAIL